MRPIWKGICVGHEMDFYLFGSDFDIVIHACKEPFHRNLLGYISKSAPKDHPEYLIAYRDKEVFMNLVDAKTALYIPERLILEILEFINSNKEEKILIHCNAGESRSAGIGFLFLNRYTDTFKGKSLAEAFNIYKDIYPSFNPGIGMRDTIKKLWLN